MSKNSAARHYQNKKEKLQKMSCERYQGLFEEEKEKSDNMALNDTNISQKIKNESWLGIEKKSLLNRVPSVLACLRAYALTWLACLRA